MIDGVKKMAQIVKAAQKMENFIKSICKLLFNNNEVSNIDVYLTINQMIIPKIKKLYREIKDLNQYKSNQMSNLMDEIPEEFIVIYQIIFR